VSDAPTLWAAYLRGLIDREDWSVARLARESGVNRSTIFRWLKGQGGLTIVSVQRIAEGAGADLDTAMRAAGAVLGPPSVEDDEMRAVIESNVSERQRERIIASIRARRARELEQTRVLIEMLEGEG
jgi:transcriptional regulator with XRE-family HTH domain